VTKADTIDSGTASKVTVQARYD